MRTIAFVIVLSSALLVVGGATAKHSSSAVAAKPSVLTNAPPEPPKPVSGWTVKETVSQLDNSRTYVASLDADNKIPNSIGRLDSATIIVRCKGGELEAYIAWPPFIGTEGTQAHFKFDQGPVMQQFWESSDSGTATFIPHPRDFLQSLSNSSRFVVDVDPYQSITVEAVFTTTGADKVVTQAETDCPT
ncbi:MAG: hypothetical protein WCA78_10335 [Rhizomicrobium sp.]